MVPPCMADTTAGRLAYVHVVKGALRLNGQALFTGDGAKIADETRLEFIADAESEILLFDLPPDRAVLAVARPVERGANDRFVQSMLCHARRDVRVMMLHADRG